MFKLDSVFLTCYLDDLLSENVQTQEIFHFPILHDHSYILEFNVII